MKKEDIFAKIRVFLAPVLVILLGLTLLFNPDSASALISRIIGGVLGLIAIGFGISAIASPRGRAGKVVCSIAFAVVGGWLGSNPLLLASWFGRIAGILLLVDGVQDILNCRRLGTGFLFPVLVTLLGLVLVLLPMTASRLIFALCGLIVLIVGAAMLLNRLRGKRRLQEPEDPNIIDAL